jgi:kumamolisin
MHPYLKRSASPLAAASSWSGRRICDTYQWPQRLVGGGHIAIVELGGAYLTTDTALFCSANSVPLPVVDHVYIGGAKQTSMADDASGEVALDVQLAAAGYSVATGKPALITIIWATDIAAAVREATGRGFDVCSISWGMDEAGWGTADAQDMEAAAAAAVNAGMVVFAASGDNDSSDGGTGAANVDCPASCPSVIGCGGTRKTATIETVWQNDPRQTNGSGTGGGYSTIFAQPDWQIGTLLRKPSMRLVPDLACNADPETGYIVWVDGNEQVIGGTSAVAPLMSGLFASFGQKLGFVLPTLYQRWVGFNDITVGENGMEFAGIGVDACSGLGSPIANELAKMFVPGYV